MAKKDEEKKVEHHHTGSIVAEDEGLTKELNRLWARNEPPERIEVWQVFGKEKRDRGEMIFHEDFPPGKKLDIEKANHLANEIIAAAQNDCDATPKRRESYYQIAIIDKNRRSVPLVRRLGPLRPQRHLALVRDGVPSDEGDMDDEELSVRSLEHTRLKTGFDELRWGTNRNDRVLGELLMLMGSIIQEQRDETRVLRSEVRDERKARDEAEDRRVQREMMLEEKKFSIGLKKEALRMGRNLLPGLFSEAREAPQQQLQPNGNGHAQSQPQYGRSGERALVDNFMTDCEEEEGLMEKLFGEAEEQDGKLVVTKPGIFTPNQARILIGVRGGFLPPEALDPLMPESGDPISITMQQVSLAMDAGITEGMGMALMELKAMRERARERNPAPPAPPTKPTTPKNPAPTAET